MPPTSGTPGGDRFAPARAAVVSRHRPIIDFLAMPLSLCLTSRLACYNICPIKPCAYVADSSISSSAVTGVAVTVPAASRMGRVRAFHTMAARDTSIVTRFT